MDCKIKGYTYCGAGLLIAVGSAFFGCWMIGGIILGAGLIVTGSVILECI